ncbi:hypothetical protein BS47DRAFT_1336567 [Hydnum rufescens UP504]|uniref:Uncharacterized protein n=1 Tax=Hydnum rufescens UP504 TaxID=1448309 RepID=A0A9P6B927_9AGAM|nr:hypothetical protein BS47DRAFT_1336567 [Hydnum rufescens UP504]
MARTSHFHFYSYGGTPQEMMEGGLELTVYPLLRDGSSYDGRVGSLGKSEVDEHLLDTLPSADAILFEIARRGIDNRCRIRHILLTVNSEKRFRRVEHPDRGERLEVL